MSLPDQTSQKATRRRLLQRLDYAPKWKNKYYFKILAHATRKLKSATIMQSLHAVGSFFCQSNFSSCNKKIARQVEKGIFSCSQRMGKYGPMRSVWGHFPRLRLYKFPVQISVKRICFMGWKVSRKTYSVCNAVKEEWKLWLRLYFVHACVFLNKVTEPWLCLSPVTTQRVSQPVMGQTSSLPESHMRLFSISWTKQRALQGE